MSEALLEIHDLEVRFGDNPAVDRVSFTVAQGETLALLGESGSGKSITALSILRLLPVAARICNGRILLQGEDLFGLSENRMRGVRGGRIAMIFQEPQSALNPVLTAGQQIGETLRCHKRLGGKALRKRCVELLDAVGIPEPERRLNDYPHQFSGGMKQRIMIATALAGEPDLLIADEPTTALDVTIQAQVLALLRDLQQRTGMSILFITHDIGVAAGMANRIAVMQHGKIVEENDRDRLLCAPAHHYTQTLFNALPGRNKRMQTGVDAGVSETPATLLAVQDLRVHFPIRRGLFKRTVGHVKAVDGVSLEISAGRTLAVVGESGSGKTTMGKAILRLLHITAGQVRFAGDDLACLSGRQLRTRRRDIQVVFQDPYASMNPRMMVKDIIAEGLRIQEPAQDPAQHEQRVDALMRQIGLPPEHKYRYPHEFSGGQRQRICIARALALEPRLIVCDEPTSALDVSVQAQILDLLIRLQRDYSLSYLFITHDISVVEYIAHEVAVMYQGQIVEHGTVDKVLLDPEHPYTRSLLSAVPHLPDGFHGHIGG